MSQNVYTCVYDDASVGRTSGALSTELPPPVLTFSLHIYFHYFFFVNSSLFPYFNLFVSIFIQTYAKDNLHVSILCNSSSCYHTIV